ncbi:alpha/beta hydrolase family protein [Gulosibacter molinativorax]|uniref:Alpha/beta hydrolase n=1 Tax=Gulosibacter molinativorax TaxID=256821 RepID=A0ABT7C5N2_9MICO|nr:alpha/beta fold hydrolase [Gulosibacter molinativorax]MDJ1370464.1 alpha/beta hydrolase [Gulosibacter molinativorax]QUY61378.1 Secreted protein [Gulosibacter molinativorax]
MARSIRWPLNLCAFLAGSAGLTYAGLGGLGVLLAQNVVTSRPTAPENVHVYAVNEDPSTPGSGTIELQRTLESEQAGQYTLSWAHGLGRAILDETVDATATTVTRRFHGVDGIPIRGTKRLRVMSAPQRGIKDLGLPWEEVTYPTELGPAVAWQIPATEPKPGHWIIHVHGRGATRVEPLRTVPLAAARGWNSLVITYRNDRGAPSAPGGHYGLGLTEWRDVDAAIEWAVGRGARRILLVGWSMGGTIVTQTYFRSRYSPLVEGIMLESPGVDWRATLEYQPIVRRVPDESKRFANWLLSSQAGRLFLQLKEPINLDEVDLVARAHEVDVPVLLLHSAGDTVVPVGPSRTLAKTIPEFVEYEEFAGARHVRLWNREPQRWERVVGQWLDERG